MKKTVEQTLAHYGRLDVLVNSAGILAMGSIETPDLAQYDKVMNINVRWDFAPTTEQITRLKKTYQAERSTSKSGSRCTITTELKPVCPNKKSKSLLRGYFFFIATNYRHCGLKLIVASRPVSLQKSPVCKQIHFSPFSRRLRWSVFLEDVLQKHNSSIRTRANGKTAHNNNPSSKQRRANSLIVQERPLLCRRVL